MRRAGLPGCDAKRLPRGHVVEASEEERLERELVSYLHLRTARHPEVPALRALVAELHASSERLATLWADPPASASSSSRKAFRHPTVGTITVGCGVVEVVGSDLRVVLWTAPQDRPTPTPSRCWAAWTSSTSTADVAPGLDPPLRARPVPASRLGSSCERPGRSGRGRRGARRRWAGTPRRSGRELVIEPMPDGQGGSLP